jgi:putative phosphoesterase
MKIGIISDTHGLMRPEALMALKGSQRILHAGDVGGPDVLDSLGRIAPVIAVRGNVDRGRWCASLPEIEVVEFAGVSIYLLHDLARLDLSPEAAGFRMVVYGHSHQPMMEDKNGVLFFNPGSAGPRRFHLPVSVGIVTIRAGHIQPELMRLE